VRTEPSLRREGPQRLGRPAAHSGVTGQVQHRVPRLSVHIRVGQSGHR